MLVGEERNKVDAIWDTFRTGGLTNPLLVIEQFTYLLFIKQLDDIETRNEANAALFGVELTDRIFGEAEQRYRWKNLKNIEPREQFRLMREEIFPFIKNLNASSEASYTRFMGSATFMISAPDKLAKIIAGIDGLNLEDRDSTGDLYEYMLSKLASSKVNGQFRTPRHIIRMMVELAAPQPSDIIVDPAMGTAGFLVAAVEYITQHYERELLRDSTAEHFDNSMFHGYDTDPTMLRIGAMNMLLHNVKNPQIDYADSLAKSNTDRDKYTLVLANPPFKGSLDAASVEPSLLTLTNTKKTELLFLSLFLRIMRLGARAAVIVPDGVLFGSSRAHRAIREELVEHQRLTAVISMPSGVFKPYAGVSTAILLFTKTNAGGTDSIWFYDMHSDGYSLDDKRTPQGTSDIPDIIARYQNLAGEQDRKRTEQSFLVPRAEIAAQGYDLSINKYKEIEYEKIDYPAPEELIAELEQLDTEYRAGLAELKAML